MIFTAAITTPANTAKTDQLETEIPIVFGKITRVIIWFPPGVNGLAHLKLLYGLQQLFPSNEQGDFAGGDTLLEWPEDIDITAEPSKVIAKTWNDDDTYDHTVTVHLVMTPASIGSAVESVVAALGGGG